MSTGLALRLSLRRTDFLLDITLTLPSQGITVLFGPSGSGKTTILRCVAGLERAEGRVALGTALWQDTAQDVMVPTHQRDLGYVFQEASLFDHMDVWSNLAFGVKRAKKPGLAQALDDAIELLGIGHLRHRPVYSLSGGERQRVAIARALAMQPQILLLDEPLASLDFARRQEILPWLEQMHKELKIPVIYVTHSLHELRRLADHVVLLSNGRVQTEGTVPAVLSHPAFIDIFGSEIEALGV